ncbi:hypothetical protein ACHQM5_002657 [Ranunculus cassubicifolius]
MFTEGLDETAVQWIQRSDAEQPRVRSPLSEMPAPASPSSSLCSISNRKSPKILPPLKFYSGLLTTHSLMDDEDSISMDTSSSSSSISAASIDSTTFAAKDQPIDEVDSFRAAKSTALNWDNPVRIQTKFAALHLNFQDLGTPPSAPPISDTAGKPWPDIHSNTSATFDVEEDDVNHDVSGQDLCSESPRCQTNYEEPIPEGNTLSSQATLQMDQTNYHHASGQSVWQTMVAYDACIRLCLNAWAKGCAEAPEFLHDECSLLRTAFGLHKFLLQPRGVNPREGRFTEGADETCTVKANKVVGKVRVEVKKIRIIPRRKLKSTFSMRGALYVEAGAKYVRHVSTLVKNGITSLKLAPFSATSEDTLSCLFQLKSSAEVTDMKSDLSVLLKPGSGDYHVFFPENQGDALLLEVQDIDGITQGGATIDISSLTNSESVRWWPIYHENECIGKVQLFVGSTVTCDDTHPIKSGQVVETLAYDLVLESAMRAQHFHARNLRLHGGWMWLLSQFAEYYGVSDSYTKLRYLSYVLNVATPTRDCLETIYELLVPVLKAKNERVLTRQEKSILLDCEIEVENLLGKVFENYKSLDELSPTGLTEVISSIPDSAPPALVPAVQVYTLLHDILAPEAQASLRNYLQTAAKKRCKRHMAETDEFMSSNIDCSLTDSMTISTAYLKMKNLCKSISNEIQSDIKIHNLDILPSSIDLSNIASAVYSTELCKRLQGFLATWPPSSPLPYVTDLLIATADLERSLDLWNIRPVIGGVNSMTLFHNYIEVWVEDKQLHLLDLCKSEKVPWSGLTTNHSTSPFAEDMYEKIKDTLHEYEVVINRWPQYSLVLENAVTNVERAIIKALEKQYSDILNPLKDSIPKKLGMHVQKLARRQTMALYHIPNQLGVFLNTIKRIVDVLHCRVEDTLKRWQSSCLPVVETKKSILGEQLNGVTVLLRTKYKTYMLATIEKLVCNMQSNRNTRLKRILEDTKEADGEVEIRERMQMLSSQLRDSISNLHQVFSSQIFVAICRGYWDRMGQIVLKFLENRKENRVWYNGSYYALGVVDDTFASQMQKLQGNALEEKDVEPPRSVVEARSILCRDTQNAADPSTYVYF